MTGQYYVASDVQQILDKKEITSLLRKPVGLFSCLQCDFTNEKKGYVLRHVRSVHDSKQYKCTICDYEAKHPSSLMIHKKSKHENQKYDCKMCDYHATTLGSVKRHEPQFMMVLKM